MRISKNSKLWDYRNAHADNFIIPKSKITKELWDDIIEVISEPYTYNSGYCLMTTICDDVNKLGQPFSYECWCITSWLE